MFKGGFPAIHKPFYKFLGVDPNNPPFWILALCRAGGIIILFMAIIFLFTVVLK